MRDKSPAPAGPPAEALPPEDVPPEDVPPEDVPPEDVPPEESARRSGGPSPLARPGLVMNADRGLAST
jgi:hypothetical protein